MKMSNENEAQASKGHIEEVASQLLGEGKKRAQDLYEEGKNKVNSLEDNVKEYSNQLLKIVQENPLTTVLIAGGIGFLLSKIMKK